MSLFLPKSFYTNNTQNSVRKGNETKHQDPISGMTRIVRGQDMLKECVVGFDLSPVLAGLKGMGNAELQLLLNFSICTSITRLHLLPVPRLS